MFGSDFHSAVFLVYGKPGLKSRAYCEADCGLWGVYIRLISFSLSDAGAWPWLGPSTLLSPSPPPPPTLNS